MLWLLQRSGTLHRSRRICGRQTAERDLTRH